MENRGKEIVSKVRREACDFYIDQLGKTHHEILKAACLVMKEFTEKVEGTGEVIVSNLNLICDRLLQLTAHENHTIRSNAFLVLEKLISKYPNEMRDFLDILIDCGFFQITLNFHAWEFANDVARFLVSMYTIFPEVSLTVFCDKYRRPSQYFIRKYQITLAAM
jgi:hypothetical protein